MITALISFLLGAAVGALVFRNNAARASELEAKAKSIADQFKK